MCAAPTPTVPRPVNGSSRWTATGALSGLTALALSMASLAALLVPDAAASAGQLQRDGRSIASIPVAAKAANNKRSSVGTNAPQKAQKAAGAIRVTVAGDRVTVADAGNRLILSNWRPSLAQVPASLRSSVRVQGLADGFDLVYEFNNKTNAPVAIESLPLPPLNLGPSIELHDFEHSGWPVALSGVGTRRQASYPNELYAPVFVLSGAGVTAGISLQYPILEFRHDASLSTTSTSFGVWQPEVRMGGAMMHGDRWWGHQAMVPPNQSRRYTVSIRFAPSTSDWKSTLQPYRDYFRTTYGPVAYTRQAAPIKGIAFAAMDRQSAANPNGWNPVAGDPHRNGYRAASRAIEDALRTSARVIVWAPTGLAYQNRALNYPPQFASRWTNPGSDALPMRDAVEHLRRISTTGSRHWGLWWGHAAEVSPGWDMMPLSRADLANPSHRALLQAELRAAVAAGAKVIGLDAFAHSHNPLWNLTGLLEFYRQEAPGVTFCTEGRACDILHRLAPTWLDAYSMHATSGGSKLRIRGPFHLADYLVPGHETWAGMCYDRSGDATLFGPSASTAAQTRDIHRIIQYGYVPVTWLPLHLDQVVASVPTSR